MSNLDDKIREALHAEDRQIFDEYSREQGLHEMVMDTFRGQKRGIVIIVWICMFVFIALAVAAAVQFFQATATKDLIMWATSFMICLIIHMMLKVWYWMELNRHSLTREVKRLELEIARLTQKLEGEKS